MKRLPPSILFALAATTSFFASQMILSAKEEAEFKLEKYSAANKIPEVRLENILSDSYVGIGKIDGAFKPANKLGPNDVVYLKFPNREVSVGDRFTVFRRSEGVRSLDSYFKRVGQQIQFLGYVQITSVIPTVTGKLYDTTMDISLGDELAEYRELDVKIEPQEPLVEVRGKVMGAPSSVELIGSFGFAFVNLGSRDGLRQNDKLYAFVTSDGKAETSKDRPEVNIAELVLVDVGEVYSTAYVVSSVDRFERGWSVKAEKPKVTYMEDQKKDLPVQ